MAIPQHETARMPLADLLPAGYNPRKMSPAAMAGLKASLEKFGELGGIVFNRRLGRLAGGHQRVKALVAIGETHAEVRVVDLDESDEKALNLTLNNPAIGGDWAGAELAALLEESQAVLGDLFKDLKLDALWDFAEKQPPPGGSGDPDDVPEVEAVAVTRPGDVWVMGSHRIICGDSTDSATVARLLGDVKPHLMVTDPPYGVEYDADWRNHAKRADGTVIGGTALGKVKNDGQADWRAAWALFPGDVAYVWHASGELQLSVAESLRASGFDLRTDIIWAKSSLVIGRGHYHMQHEPCWYAVRKGATGHWQGDRTQSTLWAIDKPRKSETGHSTQKPVECMQRPIENNSARGDAVYEPFSGSGTTIVAGEMTERRVFAVELHPPYVDVAVRRWQSLTGKTATLEGDGRTFAEVAHERQGNG
jgi:DNA modification methylase